MKKIDRLVYFGGLSSGSASRDRVANALSARGDYKYIEAFTLSEGVKNPDIVAMAARDADILMGNSAGATLAYQYAQGQELHLFAPPVPRAAVDLSVTRSLRKTGRMFATAGLRGICGVVRHHVEGAAELARHPIGNFGNLGAIAAFNVFDTEGVHSPRIIAAFMDTDDYFGPPPDADPIRVGESALRLVTLRGQHDQLLLDPEGTLEQFYAAVHQAA